MRANKKSVRLLAKLLDNKSEFVLKHGILWFVQENGDYEVDLRDIEKVEYHLAAMDDDEPEALATAIATVMIEENMHVVVHNRLYGMRYTVVDD